MVAIARAIRRGNTVLAYAGALVLLPMIVLTTVDVVGRKFGVPFPGATELTQEALLLLIFSGAAYVSAHNGHIAIELVVSRFPGRARPIANSFAFLLSGLIVAVMSWRTGIDAVGWWQTNRVSVDVGLPLYPFKFYIALGCALLAIDLLIWFGHHLREAGRRRE